MRRLLALVVLVAIAMTQATACKKAAPRAGEAFARLESGEILEVADGGGEWSRLSDGTTVDLGSEVRVAAGEPSLDFGDGFVITLARGAELTMAAPPELVKGDALVSGAGETATALATVRSRGIVRLSQGLSTAVRSYQGSAKVTSIGRTVDVPRLRQAAIPEAGLVPRRAAPITWRAGDAWDVRYLGDVISLTEELDAQSRGFGRQASSASATDIASLLGIAGEPLARFGSRRPAGETLIGGAIAAVGSSSIGSIFDLRDDGAAWGVVAVEQAGGDPRRAVSVVRDAISRWLVRAAGAASIARGADSAPLAGDGTGSTVPAASASASSGAGQTSDPSGGTSPTTTPSAPPTTSPLPTLPTVPPVTVPPAVTDPVGGVVDGVSGTTQLGDDAVDVIGGAVGGLLG